VKGQGKLSRHISVELMQFAENYQNSVLVETTACHNRGVLLRHSVVSHDTAESGRWQCRSHNNAIETLGIFSSSARQFLSSLGHRISTSSGEARETCFLFQRISVLLQRFNIVLLHDCLPALDCAVPICQFFAIFFLKPLGNIPTDGYKQ